MPRDKDETRQPRVARCSFCDKTQDQVRRIIAGNGVYICDECIALCQEIISQDMPMNSDLPGTNGKLPTPAEMKKVLDDYCRADFLKFAINGAVLGLCLHNVEHSYVEALITAAAVGIGFMLTMTLYAKLKDIHVDEEAIPAPFRGLPIALLTAGMIVLALLALQFKF